MQPIRINNAFAPLFPEFNLPPEVRYILDFSGRASGKSFASSCGLLCHTFLDSYTTLFTRQTMVSADTSIIPEFREKMDIFGNASSFSTTTDTVHNLESGGVIYFKGITASRGNQTARLKSIPHLKMWVNDESEELRSKTDFNTIDESIREKGAANRVWLIGNPSDVSHWIYRDFYLAKGVPYDYNGRVDDCWFIHSTYKSNRDNLSPSYLAKIEHLRETNYEAYEHRFLGKWLARKEGLIYKGWHRIKDVDWPVGLPQWWGVDWGYSSDPCAIIRMAYDPMTGRLFIRQVAYRQKMLVPDVAAAIVEDGRSIGYEPWQCRTYCDPARPDNRDQLRVGWSIDAVDGINRDKVGRIGYLQGFDVYYIGDDIETEVESYSFLPSKTDPDLFTDKPQDGGDHCFTADTMVATESGDVPIVDIRPGDKVITSSGLRTVKKWYSNGRKTIWDVDLICSCGVVNIKATPDHKFKTTKGWKQLKELTSGDVLFVNRSSMERHITATRASSTSQDTRTRCTGSCGNTTTEQSRRDSMSTMLTRILKTMRSAIWNLSRCTNTCQDIPGQDSQRTRTHSEGTSPRLPRRRRNGTDPRQESPGTGNTPRPWSILTWTRSARIAERSSGVTRVISGTTSAPASAQRPGADIQVSTMKKGPAPSAARLSSSTNTAIRKHVEECVLQGLELRDVRIEKVYDIQVEGMHEFFANGILVHNCMDSVQYASTHLRNQGVVNRYGLACGEK